MSLDNRALETGYPERLGFEYVDLVDAPSTSANPITLEQVPSPGPITYVAENAVTGYKLTQNEALSFAFDFRDWLYLSNYHRISATITDPKIISGETEGELEINFAEVRANDTAGTTRFEVAGRLFWEAHVFAPSYTSYTTNGFFDRQGYQEPQLPSETTEFLLKLFIPLGVVLILIAVLCYIRQRDHARAEEEKLEALKRRE